MYDKLEQLKIKLAFFEQLGMSICLTQPHTNSFYHLRFLSVEILKGFYNYLCHMMSQILYPIIHSFLDE